MFSSLALVQKIFLSCPWKYFLQSTKSHHSQFAPSDISIWPIVGRLISSGGGVLGPIKVESGHIGTISALTLGMFFLVLSIV